LLVIAIGNSTKQLSTLIGLDKTYTATIDLSLMSDTRDNDERSWKKKIEDSSA
jgi:tRNA U55 pseudouridine synthase TruB